MTRRRTKLALLPLVLLASCAESELQALGTLEWDRVEGRAVVSEPILEILVKEGDRVEAGQPLVRINPRLQQETVARARADVEAARWSLRQLEAGYREEDIQSAAAELEAAAQNRKTWEARLKRQTDLGSEDIVSGESIEDSTNQLAQARAREDAAREQLDLLRSGYREEEVAQARARLAAAEAELRLAETWLDKHTVRAERAGLVDALPFKLGDEPPVGAVLTTVLAGDAPWARVYLPEPMRAEVTAGDQVQVFVDGRAEPFLGRIRSIETEPSFTPYYTLSEQDRQRLTYVTMVDLGADAASLPLGLPLRMGLIRG